MTPDTTNVETAARFPSQAPAKPHASTGDDATFEFVSETDPVDVAKALPVVIKLRKPAMLVMAAVLGVLVVAGAAVAALAFRAPTVATGSLIIETDPPGADVRIDDTLRGTTPLTLSLPVGKHSLAVQQGLSAKQLEIEIGGGATKTYHITWTPAAPSPTAPATGNLSVVSDPPGSTVIVDGSTRGQTPLTINELSVGRHEVLVRNASTTYQRTVQVEAGSTLSLVVGGATATSPSFGWITIDTPIAVQVLENGRVIGTSEIDRIMLSQGSHQLQFVNQQLGFAQSLAVDVLAGRGGPVSLTIPRVAMNINALPWAEVFVDGTWIGDTPLANVMQPIGDHEIVFRHPQLGEKRQVTRLTVRDSLRISVDMRTR